MNKLFFAALIIGIFTFCGDGQDTHPLKNLVQGACSEECDESPASCHLQRALFLLHSRDTATDECVRKDFQALDSLHGVTRISLGIDELTKVISDPRGIHVELNLVKIERAAAEITLGQALVELDRFDDATKAMDMAETIYLSIVSATKDPSLLGDLLPRIISGLIRCGKAIDAIRVLRELSPADPNRAYLMAEAFYSIGDRESSAKYYQTWIGLGCQSKLIMLINNEYGEIWSLLLSSKPLRQEKCEQLPQELRSRLETLRQQFGHPDNIPKQSYPATIFRSQVDN